MSQDVLVVAEHGQGKLDDITFEMLGAGKALAAQTGGACVVALIGAADLASRLGAADKIVTVDGEGLENFNPESHGAALAAIVEHASPRVVMIGYTSMGMDLASGLAVKADMAHAASCLEVQAGDTVTATSQLYGGKLNVKTDLGAGPCVVSMLAGGSPADAGKGDGSPAVETVAAPATEGKIRFVRLIEPEAGGVDITAQDILVAIGRGIGTKDDVEVAEELAEELGAAVAASRPIVDAGWLPKNRQVGKSGVKVTPKVYIALGISGAPEHVEGMKGAATIIAINTDKNAPIFNVAHYGMVEDLFDVCEELTEELQDR